MKKHDGCSAVRFRNVSLEALRRSVFSSNRDILVSVDASNTVGATETKDARLTRILTRVKRPIDVAELDGI